MVFVTRLWLHYGITNIRDDLYIHFMSVLIIIGIIVRSKEAQDRVQFQNLVIIKGQARHWHQVLDQLSEGVLLIEPEASSGSHSKKYDHQSRGKNSTASLLQSASELINSSSSVSPSNNKNKSRSTFPGTYHDARISYSN